MQGDPVTADGVVELNESEFWSSRMWQGRIVVTNVDDEALVLQVCMHVCVCKWIHVCIYSIRTQSHEYIHTHAHTLSLAMHIHAYMDQSKNA